MRRFDSALYRQTAAMASKLLSMVFNKHEEIDPRPDSPQPDYKGEGSQDLASPATSHSDSGNSTGPHVYHVKVELIAASNLPAGTLTRSVDPYAVITWGEDKLFSSVVPASRNPVWGEEFDFYAEDLPVSLKVDIYDWDIVWKASKIGSTSVLVREDGDREVAWLPLDSLEAKVCIQIQTAHVKRSEVSGTGRLSRLPASTSDRQVATEVRQKPGPLQDIFSLPPDEIVLHTCSCALERSFLYHGKMYMSSCHLAFHSNVFGKNICVVLPLEDIEEMRKSLHALLNPAITIILRAGSGGHGVPPLYSPDGRPKFKLTSFWNRGHIFRKS